MDIFWNHTLVIFHAIAKFAKIKLLLKVQTLIRYVYATIYGSVCTSELDCNSNPENVAGYF